MKPCLFYILKLPQYVGSAVFQNHLKILKILHLHRIEFIRFPFLLYTCKRTGGTSLWEFRHHSAKLSTHSIEEDFVRRKNVIPLNFD